MLSTLKLLWHCLTKTSGFYPLWLEVEEEVSPLLKFSKLKLPSPAVVDCKVLPESWSIVVDVLTAILFSVAFIYVNDPKLVYSN